jgi:hypothetical protein
MPIRQLGIQVREARVVPTTLDTDARTIEYVWTTGARVRRRQNFFGESFDEELSLDDGAVRLDRLNNKAPVLAGHDARGLGTVLGVVESAWLTGKGPNREGRARVRFSKRAEVDGVWSDVATDILPHMSVGYRVHRATKIERKNDVPIFRAVDWEPVELSVVPMGEDDRAMTRSADEMYPCEVVVERDCVMATKAKARAGDDDTDEDGGAKVRVEQVRGESGTHDAVQDATTGKRAAVKKDEDEAPAEGSPKAAARAKPETDDPPDIEAMVRGRVETALAEETERQDQIRMGCRTLGFEPDVGERLIRSGVPAADAYREMTRQARDRETARQAIASGVRVTPGEQDEDQTRGEAIRNVILHRRWPERFELLDAARQYVGLSLLELGRESAQAVGVKTRGMSKMQLATTALTPGHGVRSGGLHTTSDFVAILADTQNKSLRGAYELSPRTFLPWTTRSTAPDFKIVDRASLGEAPALVQVNEHGEFERGTIGNAKESYALVTYGRVFAVTRQVIINDDLDALTRVPARFGAMAAQKESDVVWAILLANAAMADGTALFHANHGNLTASGGGGGAPTEITLSAGRTKMAKQTGLDGVTTINVTARYILVPPELELKVAQLTASFIPAEASKVVPDFIRSMVPISEPRLSNGVTLQGPGGASTTHVGSATAWYMVADPALIDTVEYMYLEGEQGVVIESQIGFDVDGVQTKARLDFAAKAIDWRGLFRDDGVA